MYARGIVWREIGSNGGAWLQPEVWREAVKRLPVRDGSDADETHFQDEE